jgi:hypothetical protein
MESMNKETIISIIKKIDKNIKGTITVNDLSKVVLVKGTVYSETPNIIEKIIKEVSKDTSHFYSFDLENIADLEIVSTSYTNKPSFNKVVLDEVKMIYTGMLDLNLIEDNSLFKEINETNYLKFRNAMNVFEFISPLVLNKDLSIIDGHIRYLLAKEYKKEKVPVLIIDVTDEQAKCLRLILNKTSEFQRWNYFEVNPFVDSVPIAQPILEPLGLFGKYVLPESFFADSMIDYIVDPFNKKQAQYQQDMTIAEWAKIRRNELLEFQKEKEKQKKKKKSKEGKVSLFSLIPQETDFLKTEDIDSIMKEKTEKIKANAEIVTSNFDAKRRPELEAKGQAWQQKQSTNKQATQNKRESFIEKLRKDGYSEEEIAFKVENYEG